MADVDDPWDPEPQRIAPQQLASTVDRLELRKREYMGIPQGVLDDLRGFCRADRSCFDPDPRIHAVMEGRREVWLRIQQHIDLEVNHLLRLYSAGRLSTEMLEGTEYQRG